ncbi:uncharacterized protein LOC115625129 [Scaptodrosophila lebanonensis]|uniref:Uncharacterized protein LOC115625129 n=1 Tax=Drosophila lebanonensis TaxID=7225 RepID=A0A6J2TIV1_DROLE|nr:uncharacterized protein LOC115625129 [Scaptodrosophila lebanonensis]
MWVCVGTLLLLGIASINVLAVDYEFILEDPEIFNECSDAPPGSLDIHGLFDLGNLRLTQVEEKVHVKGNITTVWDVQPGDRVAASLSIFHFERGAWEPTVFSMSHPDFCSIMYGKDQYWYKAWSQFIANRNDIENNCLTTPGTMLVYEPFELKLILNNVRSITLSGRYKFVIVFKAFDWTNMKRGKTICFEIRGDAEKLKNL